MGGKKSGQIYMRRGARLLVSSGEFAQISAARKPARSFLSPALIAAIDSIFPDFSAFGRREKRKSSFPCSANRFCHCKAEFTARADSDNRCREINSPGLCSSVAFRGGDPRTSGTRINNIEIRKQNKGKHTEKAKQVQFECDRMGRK